MNVKRYWVHGAYTKATLPWVLVFNREDHTEAEILVGEFAREGDARFAAHAMNCHVDLVSAVKGAKPYVSAACPVVDGKVADPHALNTLEDLVQALIQVERGGVS